MHSLFFILHFSIIFHYLCRMISKNRQKWVRSLAMKKYRQREGVFVAEGRKLVADLTAAGFECVWKAEVGQDDGQGGLITEDDLRRISQVETPQGILAVFRQPQTSPDFSAPEHELCLALDDVQNPGNLGTIVRLADWFGIEHIFCSQGCADLYNPKTVQATMGALAHVQVHEVDLPDFLETLRQKENIPVYGTFLDGDDLYQTELGNADCGVIVMGNEGNGISNAVEKWVSHRLLIPNYPLGRPTTESLNVAVATAIVCAEFRRRGA